MSHSCRSSRAAPTEESMDMPQGKEEGGSHLNFARASAATGGGLIYTAHLLSLAVPEVVTVVVVVVQSRTAGMLEQYRRSGRTRGVDGSNTVLSTELTALDEAARAETSYARPDELTQIIQKEKRRVWRNSAVY